MTDVSRSLCIVQQLRLSLGVLWWVKFGQRERRIRAHYVIVRLVAANNRLPETFMLCFLIVLDSLASRIAKHSHQLLQLMRLKLVKKLKVTLELLRLVRADGTKSLKRFFALVLALTTAILFASLRPLKALRLWNNRIDVYLVFHKINLMRKLPLCLLLPRSIFVSLVP